MLGDDLDGVSRALDITCDPRACREYLSSQLFRGPSWAARIRPYDGLAPLDVDDAVSIARESCVLGLVWDVAGLSERTLEAIERAAQDACERHLRDGGYEDMVVEWQRMEER